MGVLFNDNGNLVELTNDISGKTVTATDGTSKTLGEWMGDKPRIDERVTALENKSDNIDGSTVKLTGNQSIGGTKTFTATPIIRGNNPECRLLQQDVIKGEAPTANQTAYLLRIYDKDQTNAMGYLRHLYYTTKACFMGMVCIKSDTAAATNSVEIRCGFDANGNPYTYAPTPAAGDNSTNIATTAFVSNAIQSSAGIVSTIIYPNGGTASNPANVTNNQRYVMDNPFPGYFVNCEAQILHNGKWGWPGNYWQDAAYRTFISARQLHPDDTIIVQTGVDYLTMSAGLSGSPLENLTALKTAPCRVIVTRLGKMPD